MTQRRGKAHVPACLNIRFVCVSLSLARSLSLSQSRAHSIFRSLSNRKDTRTHDSIERASSRSACITHEGTDRGTVILCHHIPEVEIVLCLDSYNDIIHLPSSTHKHGCMRECPLALPGTYERKHTATHTTNQLQNPQPRGLHQYGNIFAQRSVSHV
jgi:hypothetical protein